MAFVEVKTPEDKKKLIAAIVLGTLALLSLLYTFGGSFFGSSKKTVTVADTSPTATATPSNAQQNIQTPITLPNQDLINSDYLITPVFWRGGIDPGPIGGRNIFAFYEPAAPTPRPSQTATPTITPTPFVPDPPPPQPPIRVDFINPQSVYAGSKGFQLQVNGSKFTDAAKIVLNGTPLQTTFVSDQRLTANVSDAFIRAPGSGQVKVDTFDGVNFSNQVIFNIQAPPKPQFEYIGMQGKKHFNNDIAYFEEKGKKEPFGQRLNDIVAGRFRLISISKQEVEFEDVRLGFKHKLEMKRPDPSTFVDTTRPRPRRTPFRRRRNRTRTRIPGIPDNIPRATPRRRATPKPNVKTNNSSIKRPPK